MPTVVKLSGHNFALLQHEEFIVGLAGSPDIPDNFLIGHMQFVWSTFTLYQGSLGAIKERVGEEKFVKELNRIWDMYLPLCQIHSDPLSQAFKVLPYVQLHKSQGSLYLHASHILQRTLRYKGVVAGALFSWKK
ncbi:hermansky-Pudlak syndrome 4 protein [Elysia marginata]|uniref:Hermansky-Pudlak syndrome 4 protein n=1 Tax=Elysia marginata TaxID=1093978 RepID=A0AAV4ISP6_9GAST|nr:hermansky-Pudlak syndrome 4 protein [Elysia marginata]